MPKSLFFDVELTNLVKARKKQNLIIACNTKIQFTSS